VSQVDTGKVVAVQMTAYSTTLLANGKDQTLLRVAVTDADGREITSATDSIRIYVDGDAWISKSGQKKPLSSAVDTAGRTYLAGSLENGICLLDFHAGASPDKIKVEITSNKLWPASHEIHTIPSDAVLMKPTRDQLISQDREQLKPTGKNIGRMIGADISFLPQFEDQGRKFYDHGTEQGQWIEKDAIELLRDHGFNYVRLRIFVNPENEKGYSPGKGYCGLNSTLDMAKRVKKAGTKMLLNFHYSDYWADPQQQNKPLAWANLDNLAGLLKAGVEGVASVAPEMPIMMHIALGGQHEEAVFWLDNMIARGVPFDVIGISYYPRWHGTLDDLKYNLTELANRYNKYLNVVEYAVFKKEVHDIVFNLPHNLGKGTCIWEPLGTMFGGMFNEASQVQDVIRIYDDLRDKYPTDEQ
jgi:hypothetical protein